VLVGVPPVSRCRTRGKRRSTSATWSAMCGQRRRDKRTRTGCRACLQSAAAELPAPRIESVPCRASAAVPNIPATTTRANRSITPDRPMPGRRGRSGVQYEEGDVRQHQQQSDRLGDLWRRARPAPPRRQPARTRLGRWFFLDGAHVGSVGTAAPFLKPQTPSPASAPSATAAIPTPPDDPSPSYPTRTRRPVASAPSPPHDEPDRRAVAVGRRRSTTSVQPSPRVVVLTPMERQQEAAWRGCQGHGWPPSIARASDHNADRGRWCFRPIAELSSQRQRRRSMMGLVFAVLFVLTVLVSYGYLVWRGFDPLPAAAEVTAARCARLSTDPDGGVGSRASVCARQQAAG
jgi:hypothetical protein